MEIEMPSLYAHEHLVHSYAERTDAELQGYASELTEMKYKTEVPRQKEVINRLLGHIVFELSYRMGMYNDDTEGFTTHARATEA